MRTEALLGRNDAFREVIEASVCGVPMSDLPDDGHDVGAATLAYLDRADADELCRTLTPLDDPEREPVVGDVLWHVMLHEARHTAQIVAFLRAEGIRPPALDLLFYLP